MNIDLTKLSFDQLQELRDAIDTEIDNRDDFFDLDDLIDDEDDSEDPDCTDYDDLSSEEQSEFDTEFRKQYPPVMGQEKLNMLMSMTPEQSKALWQLPDEIIQGDDFDLKEWLEGWNAENARLTKLAFDALNRYQPL